VFPKIGPFVVGVPVVFRTLITFVAASKLKTIPVNVAVSKLVPWYIYSSFVKPPKPEATTKSVVVLYKLLLAASGLVIYDVGLIITPT
jgi:hypothetical protein